MIDLYCASYARPPREVTLDIDDTVDVVHGAQQLSLFNTHSGERCFLPMHFYETATARPVAVRCTGQDPLGPRGMRPDQAAGASHPDALADDENHPSRRQPLRPPRGDGLVRGQRRQLHSLSSPATTCWIGKGGSRGRHDVRVRWAMTDGANAPHRQIRKTTPNACPSLFSNPDEIGARSTAPFGQTASQPSRR